MSLTASCYVIKLSFGTVTVTQEVVVWLVVVMVICEPLDSHMAALDSTVDILVEDISDHECNARSTMLRNRIDALAAFHSFVQGISCFAAQLHVLQLTEAADRRNENKRSDRVSKQTLAWQTIHQKQNELLQLSKRLTTEAEKGVNGIRTLRKLAMDLEQRALVLQRDIGEARRAALRQQEQSEAELLEIESQLSQCLQLLATTERHIRELEGKVKDAEKTRNTFRWVGRIEHQAHNFLLIRRCHRFVQPSGE